MSKRCMGCMELYGNEFEVCPHCGYVEGTKAEEAIHMEPGTLLHDRYIIGKVLGYGGFGVTYIGWDGKLEQKVAIKEYLPSEFSTRMPGQSSIMVFNGEKSEQFRDGLNKFVEEAKRLAKFQNESGIVKVFDSFPENETAYIIMEYLEGETLTERLKRDGTIPEDEAVQMLWPVMNSLQVVHGEGILHRDIAPDNIFLTKSGEVKLIDFGASRYATTSHSRSLTVIIKPGYSPEEQYRSRGDQGPHTDVYALAATLYKMITGRTPPDAMDRRVKVENQKKEMLIEPHKLNKSISVNRENAILNAMNVRIEDRTPDVQTFMNELNADPPAKRRYGKIKKIDLYSWPLWLKITVPTLLTALVTVGVLLLTGVIRFPSLFSDEVVVPEGIVVVPDVEGMEKDSAITELENKSLFPLAEGNIESEYVDAGKIVLQSPVGGSYLEESGTVRLTVSSGKGVVAAENGISTVPYVIWDTQEDAIAKLKQAGLAEPEIQMASDANVAAGKVISQSVAAGEKVAEGTQITIVVSTGLTDFEMPNVVGQKQNVAENTLAAKGLVVAVEYIKDDSVAEGNVVRQSVKAGTSVKSGTTITLTVSSGKSTVSVADVVGKSRASAESTLKGQGFKVTVLENYDSNVASGNVIRQTPVAGSSQIKGTTVTVYVSKGKQPVKVTLNANGGHVGTDSITVYLSATYGNLPTPARDYYTFAGWYTSAGGGNRIDSGTMVTSSGTHMLYAHWNPNSVSGWVPASNLPAGAQIVEQKWTYDLITTITSKNISEPGYTYTGKNTWEWSPYGGWSSWSTSAVGKSDSRDVETKTVTDRAAYTNYRYWIYRNYNHYYYGTQGWNGCNIYDQIVLTYQLPLVDSANGLYGYYQSPNCSHKSCNLWFFGEATPVPAVTHTEYRYRDRSKVYTYYHTKTESKESSREIYASDTVKNIQKYVKYRAK